MYDPKRTILNENFRRLPTKLWPTTIAPWTVDVGQMPLIRQLILNLSTDNEMSL